MGRWLPVLFWLAATHCAADASRPGETANNTAAEGWAFKLTPTYYDSRRQQDAFDLNLRANHGPHAFWIGDYQRGGEYEQSRIGYEYTAELPFGRLIPSFGLASHGFAGGAVNAEIGGDTYGLLGLGRTNRKDYYNLNFDPNDSVVLGLGTRRLPRSNLSLFQVWDNRLHTGQRVTHLVWRYQADARQRWTVDLSTKHGRPDADAAAVSGNALALTYDFDDLFLRIVKETKVNFSEDDMTRIAVGFRF